MRRNLYQSKIFKDWWIQIQLQSHQNHLKSPEHQQIMFSFIFIYFFFFFFFSLFFFLHKRRRFRLFWDSLTRKVNGIKRSELYTPRESHSHFSLNLHSWKEALSPRAPPPALLTTLTTFSELPPTPLPSLELLHPLQLLQPSDVLTHPGWHFFIPSLPASFRIFSFQSFTHFTTFSHPASQPKKSLPLLLDNRFRFAVLIFIPYYSECEPSFLLEI